MAEYIEREALIKIIREKANPIGYAHIIPQDVYSTILAIVECEPTADVAEVRHGKWIDKAHKNFCVFSGKCSECKKYSGLWAVNEPYRFCPFCGARMGDDEE